MNLHIGIDVGGTFTDVALAIPGRDAIALYKLPSTPDEPDRAIVAGVAAALEQRRLEPGQVSRLSHGTTVGTNALIERRVGKVAMVTTQGFRDLLSIGRQTRPRVYDIHLDHPAPLVPRELRLEVEERLLADGTVHRRLDEPRLAEIAAELRRAGVDSVVVGFLNAYAHPHHEQRAAELLRARLGETVRVVTSSEIFPEFREFERFSTAVLNAALFTVMNDYLDRFAAGARSLSIRSEPSVSQSVGGLMSIAMAREIPLRACLSGPAAGVMGASARARAAGVGNVITLDMGGTSADVSLLVGGRAAEVQDRTLAGFPLRMPALDVNAVGAGGGSIAWIDRDGLLKVGPHSAGAQPGPACYAAGGDAATVTDANVVLGRLNQTALLDGSMPIDPRLAERTISELADALGLGLEETALGVVQVTAAVMVKAIRAISVERGHDPTRFTLLAFGGAGPLHATEVARDLDIARVIVPANPGILCAEGLLHCDLRRDFVRSVLGPLEADRLDEYEATRCELGRLAGAWAQREGIATADRRLAFAADLRYVGQNFELTLALGDEPFARSSLVALTAAFNQAHDTAYGFASPGEPIELVCLRARATGVLDKPAVPELPAAMPVQTPARNPDPNPDSGPAGSVGRRRVFFGVGGWQETAVYRRSHLGRGQRLSGPAIVEQLDSTVLIHPGDAGEVDPWGNLVISIAGL